MLPLTLTSLCLSVCLICILSHILSAPLLHFPHQNVLKLILNAENQKLQTKYEFWQWIIYYSGLMPLFKKLQSFSWGIHVRRHIIFLFKNFRQPVGPDLNLDLPLTLHTCYTFITLLGHMTFGGGLIMLWGLPCSFSFL